MIQAGKNTGRDFDAPKKYKKWMIEAGFEDVVEKQILVPVSDECLTAWQHISNLLCPASTCAMRKGTRFLTLSLLN